MPLSSSSAATRSFSSNLNHADNEHRARAPADFLHVFSLPSRRRGTWWGECGCAVLWRRCCACAYMHTWLAEPKIITCESTTSAADGRRKEGGGMGVHRGVRGGHGRRGSRRVYADCGRKQKARHDDDDAAARETRRGEN